MAAIAIAETARLITELQLRDQLTPGLARARGELAGINAASGTTAARFSGLSSVAGGASSALGVFRGRVGSLLGATGLVGLGAGLFSVTKLLGDGIGEVRDFGSEVLRLKAVTGLTAEQTSALAGAFHHFGIEADTAQRIAGFAEKNLFKYGGTVKAAHDFQVKYGLALRDSSGHLKDFNTFLLTSADYFNNRSIPAQQKAAALALLYGRNWQALIPVLSAGRAGIAAAEEEAVKFGLTLTGPNLASFVKLRDATRTWTTALAGLKLQIGLAVIPALNDLTKAATNFLGNRDVAGLTGTQKIAGFFKTLVAYGRQFADILTGPVATGFKAVYAGWMSIPSDLRNLVITGFAADKTIKFLFGFDPLKLAFGGLAQQFFARGAPGNPMFVVPIGGGLGGPGVPVAGGPSLLGNLAKFVLGPAAAIVIGKEIAQAINQPTISPARQFEAGAFDHVIKSNNLDKLLGGLNAINAQLNTSDSSAQVALIASRIPFIGDALGNVAPALEKQRDQITAQLHRMGFTDAQIATLLSEVKANTNPKLQAAANAAAAQHLYNLGTSAKAREAGPLPGLTWQQFMSDLKRTSFIGPAQYKSIFEAFSTFRGPRGADPTGAGFLALVKRLENPKAPQVMFEIRGHLKELASLESYYLAHGDVTNATKVQGVINEVDKLIGITARDNPALLAASARVGAEVRAHKLVSSVGFRALQAETGRTASTVSRAVGQTTALVGRWGGKLDRLNALSGVTAGNTAIVARKNFSPTLYNTVNVSSTNSFNVNSLATSLVSTYTRVDTGPYAGKVVPL